LRNDGNMIQISSYSTVPVYASLTAPLSAPIQWSNGTSTLCATNSASNLISFVLCNGRSNTQQWRHNSNFQVVNQLTGLCLDVGTGNSASARSNTCDTKKASQKWKWVNGYLQVTVSSKVTSCLKAISGTAVNSFSSAIGICDGPQKGWKMAWNK
jgi:hypothetical protein